MLASPASVNIVYGDIGSAKLHRRQHCLYYPDEIEINANTYPKADFAVQITGDSMKPEYPNRKIVLVHKQTFLENGQIGIFMLNNEGYNKKYHFENGVYILMSLNSKYKNITLTMSDNFQIVGRVLYSL